MRKTSPLSRESLETIADVFKVFADATRLSILQSLKERPKSVNELVSELGSTQANISKHLRILHDANILRRAKQGTLSFYSIDDEFIFPLCNLICDKINRDTEDRGTVAFAFQAKS